MQWSHYIAPAIRAPASPGRARARRGGILIYATVSMTALIGVTSLAVDFGRLELAKTEIERAADAAARAGANQILTSTALARTAATNYASYNTVDGSALSLQAGDIVVGKWNSVTQVLDTSSGSPDTVQITAVRTAARGNPIPLAIGQVVGFSSADLTYVTRAQATSGTPSYGVVGLGSFNMNSSSALVGTYNSSNSTFASGVGATQGSIASNGNMNLNSSASVGGTIYYYGSSPSGAKDYVAKTAMSTQIATPATPSAGSYTASNSNSSVGLPTSGANFNFSSGSQTWPAGNYVLNGFNVTGGTITFSGAATLWIYGNFGISNSCTISTYQNKPANLTINLCQSAGVNLNASSLLYAEVNAPTSPLNINSGGLVGSVVASSISMGGGSIYYDTTLGNNGGSATTTVALIK